VNSARGICDVAGLAMIAVGAAAFLYALAWAKILDQPGTALLIALPCMIGAALWAWYVSEKGRKLDENEWLNGLIVTLILGVVFFVIDLFMGSTHGQYDNLVQAAFHAGSPFGIVLTLAVCPAGTLICLGGWVRTSLRNRFNSAAIPPG
jgi:peptidoglycan biosynthesis protein MviN/MurJ (putative lipid II flippase)